jgi:hypothetical protein
VADPALLDVRRRAADDDAAVPLGTLGSRPIASVRPDGTIVDADGTSELRWWVLAEDRLHVTEREAAVRQRLVDDAPVVETAVRVPGGDVVATAYGAVKAGSPAPLVGVEIRNATAVPVIIVVVTSGPSERTLTLSRRASARVTASALEGLAEVVGREGATAAATTAGGHDATLVPLPHSQVLRIGWADGPDVEVDAIPSAEQVAAGWARQVERGTRLEAPTDAVRAVWERDRRRLLLDDTPATVQDLADRVGATLRLGWFDEASAATEELLTFRGRGGRFLAGDPGADDDIASTAGAVEALSEWSRAGAPPESYEDLAAALAAAAGWLTAGRQRRRLVAEALAKVSLAVRAAASFLERAGQPDAAAALRARLDDAGPSGGSPAGRGSGTGGRLVSLIDGIAADGDEAIAVCSAWTRAELGQPVEVHELPTRWGRCSLALRWHGRRPALLWEIEPWPVRTGTTSLDDAVPTLIAPTLDPAWRGEGWTGEALLTEPEGTHVVLRAERAVEVPEGSFD